MRVAKYYHNNDVRIEDMPKPVAGPGELVVKVMASGICGSDVMEWYRIKKAPLVLGHEIAGDIVEVGAGVARYKIGQRVFVSHHVPCNTCRYCLAGYHTACETLHTTNYDPGGFAEYIRVPALQVDRGVFVLPPEISYREGACIEPLACVLRGQRIAGIKPGQTIVVMGSGISGLLHILAARALGAGCIIATDINEYRLQAARTAGAHAVNAREDVTEFIRAHNDARLADTVIVCTGALSAFKQALVSVDRGGMVLAFACTEPGVDLPVPLNDFWRNEIKLAPSYGNAPIDALAAIALLRAKRVDTKPLITHCMPLAEAARGFQLTAEGKESIKVILEPHRV